jgi:hypothetical protein
VFGKIGLKIVHLTAEFLSSRWKGRFVLEKETLTVLPAGLDLSLATLLDRGELADPQSTRTRNI